MPVLFETFTDYPDDDDFRSDLNKLYGEELNAEIAALSKPPARRLACGKFNGRWVSSALITEEDNSLVISYFYVREATRRRGVGSQLMEQIIKTEYSNKNENCSLIAELPNGLPESSQAAENFLTSLGFEPLSDEGSSGKKRYVLKT